jgi:hypothetical protein
MCVCDVCEMWVFKVCESASSIVTSRESDMRVCEERRGEESGEERREEERTEEECEISHLTAG